MSLYHEAAEVLSSWSSHSGGSLKSRIFNKRGGGGGGGGGDKSKNKAPPAGQLYALVVESSKWSGILKEVIEGAGTLKEERKLTPALSLLLVHDLLLSKGGIALPQNHGLRVSVERHKGRLASELTLARLRRKAPNLKALREQVERDAAGEEANYPRWVRVNALVSSLEEQMETTFSRHARAESIGDVVSRAGRNIYIDPHVPNLIAVSPGMNFAKLEAYTSGKIILQDKASCFPAYLLDPRSEDGDVIDACSAPGNKTTHLAAILHEHRPELGAGREQMIYAFEKDAKRAQTLDKMVKIAGAKARTTIGFGQDFLQVDPNSERFRKVGALLLDPSCSGSGIVGRDSLPDLHLPVAAQQDGKNGSGSASNKRKRKHEEAAKDESQNIIRDDDGNEIQLGSDKDLEARLEALSSFQLTLLLHAFKFPGAKKITYSTCSVHLQENEGVVVQALQSDIARLRGWRILRRQDQVSGMRDWPVRGVVEAALGDAQVAEACIRSYKGDGHGVMGFFVAGFVRDTGVGCAGSQGNGNGSEEEAGEEEDQGPYLRDDEGRIVRDVLCMPVLRETGEPVTLDLHGQTGDGERSGKAQVTGAHEESEDPTEDSDDEDEEEEWEGVSDN